MKKVKIILISIFVIITSACNLIMSPSEKVDSMLKKYIRNDRSLMEELNYYIEQEDLNAEQKNKYASIIKKEYASIKYTILKEEIDDNKSTVEVYISVTDLFGASNDCEEYLVEHPKEFYTDNEYDKSKFLDYKLNYMKDYTKTKDYTIYITLHKNGEIWEIDEMDSETLEKIHGIYDYTLDS